MPPIFSHTSEFRAIHHSKMSGIGSMGAGMGGGALDFVGNFLNSFAEIIGDIVQTVANIIETIMQTIINVLNPVFSAIEYGVAKVLKVYATFYMKFMSLRVYYDFLANAPLIGHPLKELDKFTGGMLTDGVNVSDLVYRVMRGDAIPKGELLKDALFVIKVAAIVFGGPYAWVAVLSGMVGNVACKTIGDKDVKTVCQAAFVIAGIAVGQYMSNADSLAWLEDQGLTADESQAQIDLTNVYNQDVASGAIDTSVSTTAASVADQAAFDAFDATSEKTFTDYLSDAEQKTLENQLTTYAVHDALILCAQNKWMSPDACRIVGQVGRDYINAPSDTDWATFFANEAVRLGVQQLALTWFPPGSKEHTALQNRINYVNGVGVPQVAQAGFQTFNSTGALFLLGGAAVVMVAGALS